MALEMCMDAAQLRRALADVEAAEANGFHYCLAVFLLVGAGEGLADCRLVYSDLWERGHETHGAFNWGRFQGVSRRYRLVGEKLRLIAATTTAAQPAAKPRRTAKTKAGMRRSGR